VTDTPPAPARRPRRDFAENRVALLAAARTVLAADPAASIDAIARAAGLSRRALYGHFDDRDALIRTLIADGAARFNDIAAGVGEDDPRIALGLLTVRLWDAAAHVQVTASIALDDAHVHDTAAALAPLREKLLHIARAGQQDGTLRTDVSVDTLARLVEETARTVITRMDATAPDARSVAVRAVWSIAGLSWRESVDLLAAHPDLAGADS
jgi:AcrR family transcriptional regulator